MAYNRVTLNDKHLRHIANDIRIDGAIPVRRNPGFAFAIAEERVKEYERTRTTVFGRPALRPV